MARAVTGQRAAVLLALKLVLFGSLVSPLGEKFVVVSQVERRLLGFGLDRFSCDATKPLGTLSPIPAVGH
jgi:hypothetical protein